ncbi:putative NADH dehydrogenase [ubiquinone] 1 alpha subcomplex subunit 5, mitochondrial [Glycine soja]|uniref:Putative NADH dehydrogenase [ubiquinone] 1 alpha subcomplex subunit 5, mitochondrial n=1 Tax=Glycine soja TaxID=3848 RepID=A0A445LZM3_GLYSO|nr:putative NADH dehydrogenase [ubiquinone] 1 alpha subcomplex subunit 5, mitochondrial [Glycine soja]
MTNANCPQESLHSVSNGNLRFDTAQTLVSRFLQVSSFFEDEGESPVESDETKVQTWSSQHYRNEAVVVVAAPRLQKYSSFDDQSGEKPLLLPIQSLKSRSSEEDIDVQSLNMSMSSKRFSSYSNRKAEVEVVDVDVDVDVQYLNRSTTFKRSTISQGFSSNSNRKTEVIMLSSNTYVIMLSLNTEDSVRKKGFYKSCPPPPPPTMFQKSVFMKPRFDGSSNEAPSFNKELKRSFTSERTTPVGKKSHEENKSMQGTLFRSNKFMGHASVRLMSQPAEKESLLVESDDDDDDDDTETKDQDIEGGRTVAQNNDRGKGPPVIGGESSKTDGDEGPDVDKKANEFIAKFIEQPRLQRIESIKRSARNSSRTRKLLWSNRVSSNVIYSLQHMHSDTSTLAVGGIDEWDPWGVPDDYRCEVIENDAPVPKHVPLPIEFDKTLEAL